MQDPEHRNMGRSPERSEAVSGDETKGLTAISTQQTVQPETVDPATAAPSVRLRQKLSIPAFGAVKPVNDAVTPE